MPKLGRRQSIKLGTAALLVGPSVVFSREATAAPTKRAALRAGYFKVEVKGMYDKVPGVVSVDLGSATASADYTKWIHDYLQVSLSKDAPKLSKSFKAALGKRSKVAHKVSVSLYSKASKSPAVTYHVLNAVPVSIDHKGEGQFIKWKVGSIETEAFDHKMEKGKLELRNNAFKAEVDGQVIAVQRMIKFSAGKDKAVVSTRFNPKPDAKKAWLAPRTIKLDGASDKIVVYGGATATAGKSSGKGSGGGKGGKSPRPSESFAINFTKIAVSAATSRDQVLLESSLNAGTPPASSLIGPASRGGCGTANKTTPDLLDVSPPKKPKAIDKSTPALILFCNAAEQTKGKGKGSFKPITIKMATAKPGVSTRVSGLSMKMALRSIEFPKLKVGSRALVTETLRFEVDDG